MASVRHLEFEKFRLFVKFSCSKWKFASVYQIWLKSDNTGLRYGDKAIFKIAAVRHLEFWKIAVLVTWFVLACDSSSPFRNSHWSANKVRRYSQKSYSIWRPSAILNLKNFDFLSNFHARNGNLHMCTKFDRNQIIHGWDMDIKLFSKWRPSAILNFGKLQFWSHELYWHGILHLLSEFRVDWPIRRRYIAKNDILYGVHPPSWIWQISIFSQISRSEWKFVSVSNLIEIG